MDDSRWVRDKGEGFLGRWHMLAGRGPSTGLVLCACDTTISGDAQLEERPVGRIPANERCVVCQGVLAVAERNEVAS